MVLLDDKGNTWYSQQHICADILPSGELASDGPRAGEERFHIAPDLAAYLDSFPRYRPKDVWTNNRLSVIDDTRVIPHTIP